MGIVVDVQHVFAGWLPMMLVALLHSQVPAVFEATPESLDRYLYFADG